MRTLVAMVGLLGSFVAPGCSSGGLEPLPPLERATLTTEVTWEPATPRYAAPDPRDPRDAANREQMLAEGLGDEVEAPGEGHVGRAEDGTPPPRGASARLLVRFAHLADMQIVDDESPTRVASLDSVGATNAAFRPQEAFSCRLTYAMVRALNAVHAEAPLSFVILGGDNVDSAQRNELDWMLALLGGGTVDCDSGADDDPVPGSANDPKDPFVSEGLSAPWYWVTGNHDVLIQGNLAVTPARKAAAVGSSAQLGTRDWSDPRGPVISGTIVPDEAREPLSGPEILGRVRAHRDGHGITEAQLTGGEANYTFDVPGTPLRFLVVDTAAETGSAGGLLRRADFDGTIVPALDAAAAAQKRVIVVSHHSPLSITDGGGPFGAVQPDAVPQAEWISLLTSHPAVLFALVAHSHENLVTRLEGTRPIWLMFTASVLDYPHQSRVIEVWDDDNGFLRVRATVLDLAHEDDPLAAEARRLGTLDHVIAWTDDGRGGPSDRNVELLIPSPSF